MIGSPFLKLVAEDLYGKYKGEFSNIVIVFPNNRARLFFNEHLLEVAQKPVWYPSYTTIKDLFQDYSDLQVADPIQLVCLLYQSYKEVCEKEKLEVEPLDSFYHWGEILLSDFEDVDSNLVDPRQLFQNIKDLASFETDSADYLTEEQQRAIQSFFVNFNPERSTELKQRFLSLWKTLMPTYELFREKLFRKNIAYEGMLKRSVVDDLRKNGTDRMPAEKYVFVGFNVLNKCENELFHRLHMAKKALFYWDVDAYYMTPKDGRKNEAATFMEGNVSNFPNELEQVLKTSSFDNRERTISIVSASTESAQAKYVEHFLKKCQEKETYKDKETAVVLCNEPLLMSVLHSIPDPATSAEEKEKGKDRCGLNVTMGLPIVQTPIYGLLQLLLEYQDLLYYYDTQHKSLDTLSLTSRLVAPLLHNHYLRQAIPNLVEFDKKMHLEKRRFVKLSELKTVGSVFNPAIKPRELLKWLSDTLLSVARLFQGKNDSDLYKESLYRAYTLVQRLSSLMDEELSDISYPLLTSLLDRLLSSTSVPFTGDELEGIQIMGFLETRNLDFTNVVMLSANEGTLPNSGKESSFIPYHLRVGFGMTTVEHKNALYAYYFYRLLQRAENVTFLYNISTEGSSKGQMSRFLMQLLVESGFQIKRENIIGDVSPADMEQISVKKSEDMMHRIKSLYDRNSGGTRSFSPSSFIKYIRCPLSFYFSYILGLKKQDELEDEVQVSEFGTIFHAAMRYYYEDMVLANRQNKLVTVTDYPDDPRKTTDADFVSRLRRCVEKAFRNDYFQLKENEPMPELSGDQMLNYDAVVRHMRRMLAIDKEYAPFKIISMEKPYECRFDIPAGGSSQISVVLKGDIDRVDEKEGVVRILDYKTGGSPSTLKTVESLFDSNAEKHYALQVFLYSLLYAKNQSKVPSLQPAIAYLMSCESLSDLELKGAKDSQFGNDVISSTNEYLEELESLFVEHVQRLFDPNVDFSSNKSKNACKYCDFKSLCGVKETAY